MTTDTATLLTQAVEAQKKAVDRVKGNMIPLDEEEIDAKNGGD